MTRECRQELRTKRTLNQMWNTLNKHYYLDIEVPPVYRALIMANLGGLINRLNVEQRESAEYGR